MRALDELKWVLVAECIHISCTFRTEPCMVSWWLAKYCASLHSREGFWLPV